ncbi:MAG: hypothetical protein ACOC29_01875, partial [Candidatus Sumerlaeota bacterium]
RSRFRFTSRLKIFSLIRIAICFILLHRSRKQQASFSSIGESHCRRPTGAQGLYQIGRPGPAIAYIVEFAALKRYCKKNLGVTDAIFAGLGRQRIGAPAGFSGLDRQKPLRRERKRAKINGERLEA